ncbi:phage holin [Acinetobacter nosocomialis]|uniref:phage holin n=1 Tax=Acinetobacter nosocomialis TaxID=106654 RepID=UPI0024DE1679|nr:phage holin [Acinetobacter nosocomialis]MDM9637149.1 phage holin [Acinetobacter nosocomialis]MDX7880103.1 phage holin [Acinetobacter nosocomialis]
MNDQTNSVVEAAASTAAATATKFTYGYVVGGSLIGVIGKIDWAVVFSIFIGIATFLTNLYFKKRDDKRKGEIHEFQTKQYEQTKKQLEGNIDDKRTD